MQRTNLQEIRSYIENVLFFQIKGRVLSIPSKHPGQTLVETSVEEKVFAIVMGTRGLSKLKKALLGSTSDYMMAHFGDPCHRC